MMPAPRNPVRPRNPGGPQKVSAQKVSAQRGRRAPNAREMSGFGSGSGVVAVVTLSDVCLGEPRCAWFVAVCRARDGWRLPVEDPVSKADLRPWSLRVSFYP